MQFSGFCSERKQREVEEVLERVNIDVVAGQESWEREEKPLLMAIDGLESLVRISVVVGGKEGLGSWFGNAW